MKKRKTLKIIAGVAAMLIILGLGWFANAFLGNPVSKMLAKNTAEKHLAETYAGTDYYIERIGYSFKDGWYHAFVKSPSSIDTEFSLTITMGGKLRLDTYEDVLSGSNTARRLNQEYRTLTDTVFADPAFPYTCFMDYGKLEIHPREFIDDPQYWDIPQYALPQEDLIVDKVYDIHELGRQAGHLIVYIDSDTITIERAAEIMLGIKAHFDAASVPFAAMDFVLQYPLPEEGMRPEGDVRVENFLYDDIREDGMIDRLTAADQALKDFYAALDDKN